MLNGSMSFSPTVLPTLGLDDRIGLPCFQRIVTQFVHNVVLLKVRFLGLGDIPLSADEQAAILTNDEEALLRLSEAAMEEIQLLEDGFRQAPWSTMEGRAMDGVNSIYRFTFEEVLLRWKACADQRAAKFATQALLTTAVDHQRRQIDDTTQARVNAERALALSQQQLVDAKRRVQQLESEKKADFDAYLREVCVLKEQLYRSYKDKNYVGKPVDMLRLVVDDDAGDDVSVDELLKCRRQMRSIEAETNALKEQITSLQADVSGKARFIKRLEERSGAAESVAKALQSDVEHLNVLANSLEVQLQAAKADAANARVAISKLREAEDLRLEGMFDVACETEPAKVIESKYDVGADRIPTSHREKSRLDLFLEIGAKETEISVLKREHEEVAKKGLQEIKRLEAAVHELQDKYDEAAADLAVAQATLIARNAEIVTLKATVADLETKLAAAIQAARAAEAARAAAEAARLEAEARAEDAVEKCVEQSKVLAAEVTASTKALDVVQRRNAALCKAFLNVNDKLDELKTRAGLKDYKRRANEYHFKRAEAAIKAARMEVDAREAACVARETAAWNLAAHNHHMLQMANADLREQERVHVFETQQLIKRTSEVQDAFEALLEDFNRLRADYLKAAGSTAMDNMRGGPLGAAAGLVQAAAGNEVPSEGPGSVSTRFVFEGFRGVNLSAADDKVLQVSRFALSLSDAATAAGSHEALLVAPTADAGEDGAGTDIDDLAKRRVNTAAMSLAVTLSRSYAAFYRQLHESFTAIYELDRALQSKEFSISAAEKAVAKTSETSKTTLGKGAPKPKKSLASEHAKFVANRDLAAERAGLEEQKIITAWSKLRLLSALDQSVRTAISDCANVVSTSNLLKLEQEQIANPVPLRLDMNDDVSPSASPALPSSRHGARGVSFRNAPAADAPAGSAMTNSLPPAACTDPQQSPLRRSSSMARVGSMRRLPRDDTANATATESQSAFVEAYASPLPTNAALLGVTPTEAPRRGSTGGLPAVSALPMTRWGVGGPTATTPDHLHHPATDAVPPARVSTTPTPTTIGLSSLRTLRGAVSGASSLLPAMAPASVVGPGLLSRPSTRAAPVGGVLPGLAGVRSAPVTRLADEGPFGDAGAVEAALEHLKSRLTSGGSTDDVSATPAWRRHQQKVRAQSRQASRQRHAKELQ